MSSIMVAKFNLFTIFKRMAKNKNSNNEMTISVPMKVSPQMMMMACMGGDTPLKKKIMKKMIDNMGKRMARNMFSGVLGGK